MADIINFPCSNTIVSSEDLNLNELFERALVYFHSGISDLQYKAFLQFKEIAQIDRTYIKDDDNAYFYLGLIYHQNFSDYDSAIENFTKAIELVPEDCESLLERGYCWAKKGDYKKALSDYKKAKSMGCGESDHDIDATIKKVEEKISKDKSIKI